MQTKNKTYLQKRRSFARKDVQTPRSTAKAKKKIDVQCLKKRFFGSEKTIQGAGPSWVHSSYKEFITYFESIFPGEPLTIHNFIVGAYFSYGWMPTMLRIGEELSAALEVVNKARSSKQKINEQEFKTIASVLNGSFVGTSKLLHFIRPDKYAIWDSRVYRFIFKKTPHHYQLNSFYIYQDYLCALQEIIRDKSFSNIKSTLEKFIKYPVTDLRACELYMFINGKSHK